jgi:hypothetical protein
MDGSALQEKSNLAAGDVPQQTQPVLRPWKVLPSPMIPTSDRNVRSQRRAGWLPPFSCVLFTDFSAKLAQ